MNRPSLSVIVPFYNRAEMLHEALASVFVQEYPDLQVIIVDDGSTDDWKGQISGFEVEAIEIPHCGLPGKVRNEGIRRAGGEYITFLDSDDLWLEGKLELQLAEIVKSGHPLCHTREIWDRNGTIVSQRKQKHARSGDVFGDALKKCIIGPSTVLMEKKLFSECGMFREDIEIAEDYEMWLRITDRYEVCYVDKPLVCKRAGDWPQLSEKYGMIELFRIKALRKLVDGNVFSGKNRAQAAAELALKCRIHAQGCRKRSKVGEAAEYEQLAAVYESL
ncbi:MAG: glycosyltransferase family 2 protein [Spirochaetales bacterium]|nr:glycosyltransferase family 2 protein [Spirochaetales bacterium]